MTDSTAAPASWPRPYWQPGDEEALLQFYVFGKFDTDLAIPAARYGSDGLPEGVELQRFQNAVLRRWEGYPLIGALGALLKEDAPEVYEQARLAPEVLVVRGRIADRDSLDYLRDTLGVIAALLDVGGKSVLDPQILSLHDADTWRRRYLVPGGAPPRSHVLIVCREDEAAPGRFHVHTRGLRKFGRPDVSLRNVPESATSQAGLLCERLVEMLALGARFADGQELEVGGVFGSPVVRLSGDYEDPHFNNRTVEMHFPA
ncbi:hypothetical protein [Frateuria defendens]|uniref:hypothetical protein n=1 Tax=Frateuria defendens TaxID=2219559 RepID=UPI00066FC913|nr:hypothetical protein [Frateuria defendens]